MKINVTNERKSVKAKDLKYGDTFVIEENGILSDVYMVTDEYDEDEIRLCVNLAKGIVIYSIDEDTVVIPVECKLEVTIR